MCGGGEGEREQHHEAGHADEETTRRPCGGAKESCPM
jgi:hypothetical protein